MEVQKFTKKKKSFLKLKFKQSENISIATELQNKPFKSNNNEVRTTLISVECLNLVVVSLNFRVCLCYIHSLWGCAFRNTRKTIATFVKSFASSPSNADTNKKWIFASKKDESEKNEKKKLPKL